MRCKKWTALVIAFSLAAILAACAGKSTGSSGSTGAETSGSTAETGETTGSGSAAGVTGSAEEAAAFSWTEPAVVPVIPDNSRQYSDSHTIRPGHWEKTGETFFAPTFAERQEGNVRMQAFRGDPDAWEDMVFDFSSGEDQMRYSLHYDMILDRYEAGEVCRPSLTVRRTGDLKKAPGSIYGAAYFADIEDGNDAFGQDAGIREYFQKERTASKGRVIMDCFGCEKDQDGSAKLDNSTEDHYFRPVCRFPRLVTEGDRIWLVLDFRDSISGAVRMRDVWEYSWVADEAGQEASGDSTQEGEAGGPGEEDHPEDSPEWIKNVYPGHWDRTGIYYIGDGSAPDQAEADEEGDGMRAERRGVDGQDMLYFFEETPVTITIPEEQFADRYYAGDDNINEIEIFVSPDAGDLQTGVICSLALADVDFDTGKYGVKVSPRSWFHTGWPPEDVKSFGPLPHDDTMSWRNDLSRGYLTLSGSFPEGETDGEKIWLVYGAMDGDAGIRRMFNVYEYTWTAGPDVVWRHNMPMTY